MAEDTELENNIKFFVKSHCDLIDAEYEEEKLEFKYDAAKPEIGNLEKKGVLINDLTINNVRSEFGSCIVEFGKTSAVKQNCPTAISGGDIASVWYHNEEAENKKTFLASGTVMFVGDTIKMSFDSSNPFNWDYDIYFIVKALSDVTFKRMKKALQNIINHAHGRCSMITKHLFGFANLEKSTLSPKFLNELGELKFYNNQLHDTQKEAVRFCLEQSNFGVVHGPPGTGKTTVLIEIILQLVNAGLKVLVCAPSNIAVDTLVERLDAIKSKIIRVGKTARMLESSKISSLGAAMSSSDTAPILKDVKDELEQHQKELEKAKPGAKPYLRHEIRELRKEYYKRQYKALQELLNRASVVLTTLTSASDDGDLRNVTYEHFDVVIIDECSQAIEAACWIAIPRAPKLILAGDHLQLPPTIKSKTASDCGLGVSLMERAILRMGPECYKLLTHQFRMNASIMKWVSSFYNNKLVADISVANRLLKDLPNVKETELTEIPLLVVDTAGFDQEEKEFQGSKCNECEADIVTLLIKRLIDAGVLERDISVISPYTMQVSCIKAKISNYPGVEVRTVDGFQGREKEAVIISLVRSNKKKELGFLTDKRRLNVAVSRAQCFLAVVGDSSTIGADDTISSLLYHIEAQGVAYSAHELSDDVDALNLPRFLAQNEDVPRKKKSRSKFPKRDKGSEGKRRGTLPLTRKQSSTCSLLDSNIGKLQAKDLKISSIKKDRKVDPKDVNISVASIEPCLPVSSIEPCLPVASIEPCLPVESIEPCLPVASMEPCLPVELSDPDNNENAPFESETPDLKKEKQTSSKKKQTKFPKKKTSKSKKLDESDDSDEDLKAIAESKRRNSTCFMKGCKTSVKLFPQLCQHCNEVFCLAHMLPEVHGCGEAAKRSAKHNFRLTQTPKSAEKDKNIASQKLKQKVAQLAAERKRQAKK